MCSLVYLYLNNIQQAYIDLFVDKSQIIVYDSIVSNVNIKCRQNITQTETIIYLLIAYDLR